MLERWSVNYDNRRQDMKTKEELDHKKTVFIREFHFYFNNKKLQSGMETCQMQYA